MIGTTNAKIIVGGQPPSKQGKYFIKVIDYDGTIIDEQRLNDGEEYTLPSAPSHTGLVFQEWSSSETITNGKITIDKNNVMVGAIYTTSSGQSEFDIDLTISTGLSVSLNMDGIKDWGDGTVDTNTSHTYTNTGIYTIKCNGTLMTTSSSSGLFGQNGSSINYYVKNIRFANITTIGTYAIARCYSLASIVIPSGVTTIDARAFFLCCSLASIVIPSSVTTIGSYLFYDCYSLTSIVIPSGITTIDEYLFYYCYSLASIAIPNSVTTIGSSAFYYCYSLASIAIPNSVTTIGSSVFYYCYSLASIAIPSATTIGNDICYFCSALKSVIISSEGADIKARAFYNCYANIEYDFSTFASVPTLANTNAFININKICKIKVPNSLLNEWKAANNWSTYADYIVGV